MIDIIASSDKKYSSWTCTFLIVTQEWSRKCYLLPTWIDATKLRMLHGRKASISLSS